MKALIKVSGVLFIITYFNISLTEIGDSFFSNNNELNNLPMMVIRSKQKNILCEIRNTLNSCCKTLNTNIESLLTHLPCTAFKTINSVPATITESGIYCVSKELNWDGEGAAITIKSTQNVSIIFSPHALTLGPSSVGVFADGVTNLLIQGAFIKTPKPSLKLGSAAIKLANSDRIVINKTFTANTLQSIVTTNCNNLVWKNNHSERHFGNFSEFALAFQIEANNVLFTDSTFKDNFKTSANPGAFLILSANKPIKNATVRNCQFINTLFAQGNLHGLLIENSLFLSNNPNNGFLVAEIGIGSGLPVTNAIIKNCTFSAINSANTGMDGFFINPNTTNTLLENCVFDSDTTPFEGYVPAVIHTVDAKNVLVKNCIIRATGTVAFMVEQSSSQNNPITASDCLIENSPISNIALVSATSAVIQNCKIQNGHDGIVVSNSSKCSIKENDINSNVNDGIIVDAASTANNVQSNQVNNNRAIGINNLGNRTNQFYYNTACNNGTNYFGVPNVILPNSNLVAGANLACS